MATCTRCNKMMPVGAAFCTRCGAALPPGPFREVARPPTSPPPFLPYAQPRPLLRLPVVQPRSGRQFGCGTIGLILLAGCCLWGRLFPTQSTPPPPRPPQQQIPYYGNGPQQPPPPYTPGYTPHPAPRYPYRESDRSRD